MRQILVSEYLPEEHLSRLRVGFEVVYDPDLYADRPRLLEKVADAVAIFTRNRTQIDAELLAAGRKLKVVGRLGVGLDNIDMEACSVAGVVVVPAVGGNAVSVAEYVIGAMLMLVRGVFTMTGSMIAGEWPRQGHAFGRELKGMTLGLVGFGSIARQVAARAAAFEMRIVAHDPFIPSDSPAWQAVERVELDELLAEADVVSLHTPLTEQTANLIDWSALEKMRSSALLINTSRGGTVDEAALAGALRNGIIGGAALDVFASEPLRSEGAATFTGLTNLILTPHIAGNTYESVDRVARMIVAAVLEVLGD
ncbi:MAG: hydroxyacid dehydrogenase [Acidimicrobiia bacterium]|nr:hydroxyacid dehydrogenase [Acidimicrobiia bacterium]